MSEWKSGDVVRLKTGGPPMTVDSIDSHVNCVWFERRATGLSAVITTATHADYAWEGPKYGSYSAGALERTEPLP